MANAKCKECGCNCKNCANSDHDVHLHVEIENLKQKLLEKENHIVKMETNFLNEANKAPGGQVMALTEELLMWQDKYRRLYDAHKRVQRVNQGLEDKLLKLVDVCETDKNTLTKDVAVLSQKLAEANYAIKKLTDDNERYKVDVQLAIQFLQCKQSNFVAQRVDTLPLEIQNQVASFMSLKKKPEERKPPEPKSIKVPIPTFPPTAMVYSVPKSPNADRKYEEEVEESQDVDIVSAAIMAKVLEERQRERSCVKHCDTCTCSQNLKIIYDNTHHTIGTQTEASCNVCFQCKTKSLPVAFQLSKNGDHIHKKVPIITETDGSNVVKVQPNNFLLESNSSKNSSVVSNTNTHAKPIDPNNHLIGNEISLYQESLYTEKSPLMQAPKPKPPRFTHHHLCDKTTPMAQHQEELTPLNQSDDAPKGPRYCSMRWQSGSRNILLDNAHTNVAPVLYTRHKTKNSRPNSASSSEVKNSITSDTSTQNQQRVAEWVENQGVDDSSPDHSRSEELGALSKVEVNKAKYKEMEENVKRFLFGESEFMKTVELGKLKYQHLSSCDKSAPVDGKM